MRSVGWWMMGRGGSVSKFPAVDPARYPVGSPCLPSSRRCSSSLLSLNSFSSTSCCRRISTSFAQLASFCFQRSLSSANVLCKASSSLSSRSLSSCQPSLSVTSCPSKASNRLFRSASLAACVFFSFLNNAFQCSDRFQSNFFSSFFHSASSSSRLSTSSMMSSTSLSAPSSSSDPAPSFSPASSFSPAPSFAPASSFVRPSASPSPWLVAA